MDLALSSAEIRAKVALVVLLTAVAGIAAFAVSSMLPKTYTAESRVLVGTLTDADYDQLLGYGQLAQTYTQLALTTPVLSAVIADVGLEATPEEVAQMLDVRAPTGLTIIQIEASAPTPEGAAALADAVAKRITELSRVPSPGTGNIATVVQPAVPPASASSPRVLLNTAIAAALGMALGVLISLVPAYRRANRAPEPVVTRLEPAVDS